MTDRVRAQYDGMARGYDARWQAYIARSVAATLSRLAPLPGNSVLDVGAGTGLLLDGIRSARPGARLVGVDLSARMLGVATERLGTALLSSVGDAAALPFREASFDLVVSSSSLHYWNSPTAGLRDLARVLRPGGYMVITDWCHDYLACRVLDRVLRVTDPAHHKTLGASELRQGIIDAGCSCVLLERYRITWFWGLMTAVGRKPG